MGLFGGEAPPPLMKPSGSYLHAYYVVFVSTHFRFLGILQKMSTSIFTHERDFPVIFNGSVGMTVDGSHSNILQDSQKPAVKVEALNNRSMVDVVT